MNWQRNVANWVTTDRSRPHRAWRYSRWTGHMEHNPAANVTSNPEHGTGQHSVEQRVDQNWPNRCYDYQKRGQFVQNPNWVATEIFLPTETPQVAISPFLRRAGGFRVMGRYKSPDRQLNKTFDLFASDPAADALARGLFQPPVIAWLLSDPRTKQVNLSFQTIVLWEGKDNVPFTQRHGVLTVEMPGSVRNEGTAEFLVDIGATLLGQLSAQLWYGQPPSGRPGR